MILENKFQRDLLSLLREETRLDHNRVDRHPLITSLMSGKASLSELELFTSRQASWLKSNFEFLKENCYELFNNVDYDLEGRLAWLQGSDSISEDFHFEMMADLPVVVGLIYVTDGSLNGLQMTNRLFKRLYPSFSSPLDVPPKQLHSWWIEASTFIANSNLSADQINQSIDYAKRSFQAAYRYLLQEKTMTMGISR